MRTVTTPFRTVVLLGVAIVAGCASFPVPTLDRSVPANWSQKPVASPRATSSPTPDLTHWWKAFADPELDAIIQEALHGSLDLREARQRLKAARALEKGALTQFQPTLSFKADTQPYAPVDTNYFEVGFDAEWELGLFGRRENSRRLGQSTLGSVESRLKAAEVSLVSEAARTYIGIRTTQAKIMLLQQASASEDELLDIARKRRELGLASALAESEHESEYAAILAQLDGAHADLESALLRLGLLLGRQAPDARWREPAPIPLISSYQIRNEPADLLRTRPEIREAENRVLIAASRLGLAKGDLFPKLSLGGFIGISSRMNGLSLAKTTEGVFLGPSIEIPLFDWGRRKAVIEARDAELSAALIAYRKAVLQGVSDVERAFASLQFKRATVSHRMQVVDASSRAVAGTEKLIELKLKGHNALAQAQKALAVAELDLVDARYQEALAVIALYKALGGAPLLNGTVDS